MIIKRISTLLVCGMLLSGLTASAQTVAFPDVSAEHWAYADIQKASGYGLVQGLEDGTFRPEGTLNRAAFVTILQRMFAWESISPAAPSFSDIQVGDWYYAAAETARAHGVTGEDTLFQPNAYITREEMALMLVRALGYESLAEDIADQGLPFPDVTTHPGHIALAAAIGMTNGVEVDGTLLFQPDAFATRGQAAAMLSRVYERYLSPVDWLNGFYAFSSFSQIQLTAQMDVVSVGWSRMSYDVATGPWLNSTQAEGNDWVKPQDVSPATSYFQGNNTPYNLNVYADVSKNVALPDGSKTSVLETILPDPTVRGQATAALVAAVPEYAGITIDFEGLKTELLKADFVAFMTELRAALPADKTLYVCVPPDDWYKGYDFRALGEICDKVIYMVHDYQWTSVPDYQMGKPMGTTEDSSSPVTPFPDVYRALCAITHPETGVQDRSKIALQISFGTAGFEVDEAGNLLSSTIYHPAPDTIAARLAQPGTVVSYDPHSRNPMAQYTTEEGRHILLWYEDARSVADKLTLARMFGITGVSVWRLGTIPSDGQVPNYDVWSAVLAQR